MLLPVREVLMMYFMDRLTNVPGWHIKVFDDDYVAYWRGKVPSWGRKRFALSQALPTKSIPTISNHAFEFVRFKSPCHQTDYSMAFMLTKEPGSASPS